MSKKALIFGLFLAVLVTSAGTAFGADGNITYPQPTLTCTPSVQSVTSGQLVTFTAVFANASGFWPGQLTWQAPGGDPSIGTGLSFATRFYTSSWDGNDVRVVTVTDGSQTAVCTVYVYGPVPTWTPTPTPTPPTLSCSPSVQYATSGQRVRFDAIGYGSYFSWTATDGSPTSGYGSPFFTRFYNYGSSTIARSVSLTNGTQWTTCTVYVIGSATPAPTPTTTPYLSLTATQYGRNVTRGQGGEYTSVRAGANDTLDFIIRVRNNSNVRVRNVSLTDILPGGLQYISRSTAVNGTLVADGITSSGLNIGTLSAGQEAVVRFSAKVDSHAIPLWGYVSITNTAQIRADDIATTATHLRITLGQGSVLGSVGQVQTGPVDSILLAIAISALVTGLYAVYTRTNLFGRRFALASIRRTAQNAGHPNFLK